MNMARYFLYLAFPAMLTACGGNGTEDLQQFMDETTKDMQGKVEPLPKVQAYAPFDYAAFNLPDPFKPRKLTPSGGGGGLQPDMVRPKEPLEAYSLETLKMVGIIGNVASITSMLVITWGRILA